LKVFHTGKLLPGIHTYNVDADALDLTKGAYLVRISTDSGPAVARLLKVE